MKSLISILLLFCAAGARGATEHAQEADGAREEVNEAIQAGQWQGQMKAPTFPLSPAERAEISGLIQFKQGESFGRWIRRLETTAHGHDVEKKLASTVSKMLRLAPIDSRWKNLNADQAEIYRWLVGLYTQQKYGAAMASFLGDLVSLQTLQSVRVAEWSQPPAVNPDMNDPAFKTNHPFQYAQLRLQQFAEDAGLISYNKREPGKFVCPAGAANVGRPDCSHKIFVIELAGRAQNATHPLGLYVHVDVVPNTEAWNLLDDNGKVVSTLNPFSMTLMSQSDLKLDATRANYSALFTSAMQQYQNGGQTNSSLLSWAQYLERKVNDLTGDRYYGRGTIDDKAQIVSGLYALKTMRELQTSRPAFLPILTKPIQLIVETSEETTTEGVDVYLPWAKARGINSTAEVNIGLDANYPACIAEDGIYREQLNFPSLPSDPSAATLSGNQVMIDNFHGAEDPANQAHNQIPGLFKMTFVGPGIGALKTVFDDPAFMSAFENFLQSKWKMQDPVKAALLNNGETVNQLWHPLGATTELNGSSLILRLNGYERVSFKPQDADSAYLRGAALYDYLQAQIASGKKYNFTWLPNAYTRLAHFIWDKIAFDYYGTGFGLQFMDRFNLAGQLIDVSAHPEQSFMGHLTVVPTEVDPATATTALATFIDMRVPRNSLKSATDQTELATSFASFGVSAHAALSGLAANYGFTLPISDPTQAALFRTTRYVDPTSSWMTSLTGIYQNYTGRSEWGFVAIAGSTTAGFALNGINFGPTQPFEDDVYHVPNEYKKVSDLQLDLQMFTNAFINMGDRTPTRQ